MGLGLNRAAHDLVYRFAFSAAVPMVSRWKLLRRLGWHGIERTNIRDGCLIIGFEVTMVDCYLNRQVFIDASAPVHIGTKVQFGPRASVHTSSHHIGSRERRAVGAVAAPVTIGDGCWIGAGAMVLPGVTIAPGCVVAAGAVVTSDTEPDGLYAGVPAKRVRDLD